MRNSTGTLADKWVFPQLLSRVFLLLDKNTGYLFPIFFHNFLRGDMENNLFTLMIKM